MSKSYVEPRCSICKGNRRFALWQPAGPSDHVNDCFSFPGQHYRGFPAIGVCEECYKRIRSGEATTFRYKGKLWLADPAANTLTVVEDE